jgi:hypothetical protein
MLGTSIIGAVDKEFPVSTVGTRILLGREDDSLDLLA